MKNIGYKIEKGKYYSMPTFSTSLERRPEHQRPVVQSTYHDVTTLWVSYLTEKENIERMLPEPFETGPRPVVGVFFQCCKDVEWLGGGGYNLVGINVAATFKGKRDTVTGDFCLVMWENLTEPIISGREILGVPKVYAQIPDPVQIDSTWYAHAERHGLVFLEMNITDIKPVDVASLGEAPPTPWMGWKYIPRIDGPGADVSYATAIESGGTPKEAWTGKGTLKFRKTSPKIDLTQAHIINAVSKLEIKEYLGGGVSKGSITLGAVKEGKHVGGRRLE